VSASPKLSRCFGSCLGAERPRAVLGWASLPRGRGDPHFPLAFLLPSPRWPVIHRPDRAWERARRRSRQGRRLRVAVQRDRELRAGRGRPDLAARDLVPRTARCRGAGSAQSGRRGREPCFLAGCCSSSDGLGCCRDGRGFTLSSLSVFLWCRLQPRLTPCEEARGWRVKWQTLCLSGLGFFLFCF